MKKILVALVLCMVSILGFGQITISSEGSSRVEDYVIKGMYYNIKCYDSVYILNIKDLESTEFIRIKLGNTTKEAYNSLNTLYDWFKQAKTKDYIEFNTGETIITMYKCTSTVPYFSEGDIEYIKSYIKNTMLQGMFGTPYRRRNNDKMVGCIDDIGQIKKALKKLQDKQ